MAELKKLYDTEDITVINEEIAANACFTVFAEQENFEKLVQDNKSLARKVKNFFATFVNRMKAELRKLTAGGKYSDYRVFSENIEAQQQVVDMMNKMLKEYNATNSKQSENYSIAEIKGKNKSYGLGVILDTNIFNGVNTRNWGKVLNKFVYDNLAGEEVMVFDESGNEEITSFAKKNERVKKDGSKNYRKVIDKLARKQGLHEQLAVAHSIELISVSEKENRFSMENTHQWLDENGWEYRTVYIQDIKTHKIFSAELNIANTKDGRRILYDINKIKKVDDGVVASAPSKDGVGSPRTSTSINIIPQNREKDNTNSRFSLSENVEQTKDLIAVHNISEEKLVKSLRLGGLPMPSIAIARAQYGHTNFGNISLVFPKSTIDPEYNNAVWSGDAYTPTYPQIDYKIDRDVVEGIDDKITELLSSKGYTQRDFGYLGLDSDNVRDAIKYGGVVERYKNKAGIMAAYLIDKGIDFTPVMREKSLSETGRFNNKQVIAVANALGEDKIMKAVNGSSLELEQYYNEVADALNQQKIDEIKDKISNEDLEKAKKLRLYKPENTGFAATHDLVGAASEYFEKGITQVISEGETKDALKEKIADENDFEKWVGELFSNVVEKEGIRNNRDYYTSSGYPRSFEALHYEHTLENVVRAMQEKGKQGLGAFGGNNIFGASKVEYNTVAEIKEAADKLIDGTSKEEQEKYEEERKKLSDRFFELAYSLPNYHDISTTDSAADVLTEAVLKYSTKTAMDKYIRRELEGWANYSPTIIDDLMGIVDDIRALPAAYFEAKPQRAVSFNEVYTAIIPDNSSAELKDALKNAGVKYETYKHGDDKARVDKLNSLDEVKFSRSEDFAYYAPNDKDHYATKHEPLRSIN